MYEHTFLTQPATWLGEGVIQLNLIKDPMQFYSRWTVSLTEDKQIQCTQEIEVSGLSDRMHNFFSFKLNKLDEICVQMENTMIGKIQAKGLYDEKIIAWEYQDPTEEFGGYEFYRKEDDGYRFCCEFITSKENLRTHIQGRMWMSTST